jgi:F-type H+-transporting ATPase subunit delta
LTANIVSRRYAKALFALGREKGDQELDAYGKGLAELAAIVGGQPELQKVFKAPLFSPEEKKSILDKLLKRVAPSQMVANFVHLLADKDRLGNLLEIQSFFEALLDEHKGLLRGALVTAVKLEPARQEAVKKQLKAQLGKELVLDFAIDPQILGGVVLKVGDKILDASLKAQLQIIKEQINRGE